MNFYANCRAKINESSSSVDRSILAPLGVTAAAAAAVDPGIQRK